MSGQTGNDMDDEKAGTGSGEKCEAILKRVLDICNSRLEKQDGAVVSFGPDWNGNSLTIFIEGMGHTHCGNPDGTFRELVDQLHALLCEGRGLSFSKTRQGQ